MFFGRFFLVVAVVAALTACATRKKECGMAQQQAPASWIMKA